MRPNVLLIQCDDLGPDDLGLDGPHTPNLLTLEEEAFSAKDFSVQPVCSPSRAALMTGRHPLRAGVSHVHGGKDFLHPGERTLAGRFQAAGYATGMWGKWHLGHTEGYFPWQRGFDEAYMADLYKHRQTKGSLNGAPRASEKWADEEIVGLALDFIHRHRDQRWFAYLPTLTPHTPHDAPEHWVRFHVERGCPPGLAVNRAMISFLDEQIGRLLEGLRAEGLADDTLVVFMSDHGPAIAANELDDTDRRLRNRSGRRGWKGDLYENGVQSPLMIRLPGRIAPRVCREPLQLLDVPPTLLALCGLPAEDLEEGRSFADSLLEGIPHETGDIFTYAHRGWLTTGPPYSLSGIPGEYDPGPPGSFEEQSLSLRRGRMKLIFNPEFTSNGKSVLYNLSADPCERDDLSDALPELCEQMTEDLRRWWASVLREPHAFQPPVLRMRSGENRFPANLPSAVCGGTVNCVNGVQGWDKEGSCITYQIHASVTGTATLSLLDPKGRAVEGAWECRLPDTEIQGQSVNGTLADIPLHAGLQRLEFRAVRVPAHTRLASLRSYISRV
ncbi:MAG: sulfatase-like hydrolase/transferase [Verrucomicrobia bacterium]|nr:sulfatase-like hydrolase/transferase [Verrucomicrobiota bacterium]MCH8527891.1 sulfatase-like hydrolase/transferase [Kiritimatiellia bacterium]